MKERIQRNPTWMASITERAENLNIPVDSVLSMESAYFIEKHPEACFPALNDSLPHKRSSEAERLVRQTKTINHN